MLKFGILTAALAASLVAASPANAVLMDAIKVTSSNGEYLQIAELQAYSGGVNVALASNGAVATSFSSLFGSFTGPEKANDGFTDGQPYGHGVYISQGFGSSEYLLVTFAHTYDISAVRLFGREDCCQQRDDFTYILMNQDTPVGTGQVNVTGQGNNNRAAVIFARPLAAGLTTSVPEPSVWAMMLAGFGGLGLALRARRRTSAAFA